MFYLAPTTCPPEFSFGTSWETETNPKQKQKPKQELQKFDFWRERFPPAGHVSFKLQWRSVVFWFFCELSGFDIFQIMECLGKNDFWNLAGTLHRLRRAHGTHLRFGLPIYSVRSSKNCTSEKSPWKWQALGRVITKIDNNQYGHVTAVLLGSPTCSSHLGTARAGHVAGV